MVALTVIMAGIIAAYAFGLVQATPMTRNVVVTVDQPDASHMYVTYRGGYDHAILMSLTVLWPSGVPQTITSPKIGEVYTVTNTGATTGSDHVVVIGHFRSNVDQVLLDTMV